MSGFSHEWHRESAGVHRNWRRNLEVRRAGKLWYIAGEPYTAFQTLADAKAEVETRAVAPIFAHTPSPEEEA